MRTLALPKEVEHWSLTTIREKRVKIGAKVVAHGRYVTFQMAKVAVPRDLFRKILQECVRMQRNPTTTGYQRPSGGQKSSPACGNAICGYILEPVRLPSESSLGDIWEIPV